MDCNAQNTCSGRKRRLLTRGGRQATVALCAAVRSSSWCPSCPDRVPRIPYPAHPHHTLTLLVPAQRDFWSQPFSRPWRLTAAGRLLTQAPPCLSWPRGVLQRSSEPDWDDRAAAAGPRHGGAFPESLGPGGRLGGTQPSQRLSSAQAFW